MSVSYKVIGRHIQEARKQAKLTQGAVAEKLNMSDTYYGKIERGECHPNLERLAQISILLNIPLEDLISGCVENSAYFNMNSARKTGFADQFAEITAGCSAKSCNLMLRVCREIAQADKE